MCLQIFFMTILQSEIIKNLTRLNLKPNYSQGKIWIAIALYQNRYNPANKTTPATKTSAVLTSSNVGGMLEDWLLNA